MAEIVRISPDGRCILVSSLGPPSLQEMEQTLSAIVALSTDHKVNRVLVDSRFRSGHPSPVDIFRGGQLLAEKLRAGIRVAVLVRSIEGDHKLFENVAVNRGAEVNFFQDEAVAHRWLSEGK